MAASSMQKSTTVRLQTAAVRAAGVVAPGPTARWLRDRWFRAPARMPAHELPGGGTPFTVTSQGTVVRGTAWGEGPVVYLVHGWGGRGSQLASFVAPLVAAGHRVVMFDGPSHGDSDTGRVGRGRTHGIELARALDEVFCRFGPAQAVVAHSLGTLATYFALRFGWLGTERLVLLAPVVSSTTLFDRLQAELGFGPRFRRRFDRSVAELVGVPMEEFDARVQAAQVQSVPTLVVHDRGDRQAPYDLSVLLAHALPDAELVATEGLGHQRLLADPGVVARVVEFVAGGSGARRAA